MTHSILDLLRNAVVHYGYWAVGAALLLENAGVPVPGETILLLASFLAYSEHELQLPWIIVVATIAATLGDNLGFALGYYGGRPLLERYQALFRIQQSNADAGRAPVCSLWRTHYFLCPLCVWHADHRGADGRSSTDAVAQVSDLQLSRRGAVGHSDFGRWLLIRPALDAFGARHQAIRRCGRHPCANRRGIVVVVEPTAGPTGIR